MAFAPAIGSYPYWCVVMFLCERAQTPNAITKRYQQTLPLMGATRPASGIKAKALTDRRVISAACGCMNLCFYARRGTRRPH